MKAFGFLCFTVLIAALCLSSSAFRFCTDDWQCPLHCTCRYGRCDCSRWKREAPKQLDQAAVAATGLSSSAAYHDGCSSDWECPWGCTCNWFGRCECRFRREEPWLLNRFAAGPDPRAPENPPGDDDDK